MEKPYSHLSLVISIPKDQVRGASGDHVSSEIWDARENTKYGEAWAESSKKFFVLSVGGVRIGSTDLVLRGNQHKAEDVVNWIGSKMKEGCPELELFLKIIRPNFKRGIDWEYEVSLYNVPGVTDQTN
jgi:hypothetical protein